MTGEKRGENFGSKNKQAQWLWPDPAWVIAIISRRPIPGPGNRLCGPTRRGRWRTFQGGPSPDQVTGYVARPGVGDGEHFKEAHPRTR